MVQAMKPNARGLAVFCMALAIMSACLPALGGERTELQAAESRSDRRNRILPIAEGPGAETSPSRFSIEVAHQLFDDAGFGAQLKKCEELGEERRSDCKSLHAELGYITQRIVTSRRDGAKRFVINFLSGMFDPLLECLRTSCNGLFVMKDGTGAEWAERWRRLLAFQACIHAVPAVTPEKANVADGGYAPLYRLYSALAGEVYECSSAGITKIENELLKKFNYADQF